MCTKFDFAYSALPDPLAGLIRGLLLRGVEWKRKEGREGTENGGNDREGVKMPEEGEVRSGERTKKERKRRKVRTPLLSIPAYAPGLKNNRNVDIFNRGSITTGHAPPPPPGSDAWRSKCQHDEGLHVSADMSAACATDRPPCV